MTSIHQAPPSGPINECPTGDEPGDDRDALEDSPHVMTALAQRMDWWPRRLGVHVDGAGQRVIIEPEEGAASWLSVVAHENGWGSPAQIGLSKTFAEELLRQLREHQRGVSPRSSSRLPADAAALVESLREIASRTSADDVEVSLSPRPKDGELTPGERIGPWLGLPSSTASASQRMSTLKGQASQSLGAMLEERFSWIRPVPIESAPFERLARNPPVPGKAAPRWGLFVDKSGRNVELGLRDGAGRCRSLGVVLKAGPHLEGLRIFRPNDKDSLAAAWNEIGEGHNGAVTLFGRVLARASDRVEASRPLAGIPLDGRVMVLGHGNPGSEHRPPTVARLTPGQLAGQLVAQGLPRAFRGTVFLNACESAQGLGRTDGFTHQLQRALAARGWRDLSVAGRPGVLQVGRRHDVVTPTEVELHRRDTVARTDRLIARLTERQASATAQDDARLYARLIDQETAYAGHLMGLGRPDQRVTLEAHAGGADAAPGRSPEPKRRPWYRRQLDRLARFLRLTPAAREAPPATAPSNARGAASRAAADTYLGAAARDEVSVRGMWAHVGPSRATPATGPTKPAIKPAIQPVIQPPPG